jgi:REP element-mobilizing transposase RayT
MIAPKRKPTRMGGFDYSTPGCYFVTINTRTRGSCFGTVHDGVVSLNAAGSMVQSIWRTMPSRFPGTSIDMAVVMPDHIHGILVLGYDQEAAQRHTISDVIGAFKSITTVEYGRGVRAEGWQPYAHHLWHPSFRDTIIRSDRSLERFRNYTEANPARWTEKHGK